MCAHWFLDSEPSFHQQTCGGCTAAPGAVEEAHEENEVETPSPERKRRKHMGPGVGARAEGPAPRGKQKECSVSAPAALHQSPETWRSHDSLALPLPAVLKSLGLTFPLEYSC